MCGKVKVIKVLRIIAYEIDQAKLPSLTRIANILVCLFPFF